MAKRIRKILKLVLLFLFCIVLFNVLEPLFHRRPDPDYARQLASTSFKSEVPGSEKIRCIDDNEEALLWRLRMIAGARDSVTLATFDMRPDDSGTAILAALHHAAEKGVKVKILIDGIYQTLFLGGNDLFQALAQHENVEVRVYNPITPGNMLRLNYRMHDKYILVDDRMYLLGGRNTNDIFLGRKESGINIDRDILVYDTSLGEGESLQALQDYFLEIWEKSTVRKPGLRENGDCTEQYRQLRACFDASKESYPDIEGFDRWEEETREVNKITLVHNGTQAGQKTPQVLQAIEYLAMEGDDVVIQTPYVICSQYMYEALEQIAARAELKIILNAVEKGSNPWGCTDYLNNKKNILKTGADVYELMNEHAVHTKTILVDENISMVGSYNLDMRSTYLDTELMLVIDSPWLNEHIREIESDYQEKSREVLSNGQERDGRLYQGKELSGGKKRFYGVLRVLIRPFRHLL